MGTERWWRACVPIVFQACTPIVSFPSIPIPIEPENSILACGDGLDNDQNGLIDCDDAVGCGRFCPEASLATCSDGIDNDLDPAAAIDHLQVSCWGTRAVDVEVFRSDRPLLSIPATPLAMTFEDSTGLCALVVESTPDLRQRQYVPQRDFAWPTAPIAPSGAVQALRILNPTQPDVLLSKLSESIKDVEAAAMGLSYDGVLLAVVRARLQDAPHRLVGLTSRDCNNWTIQTLEDLREPFATGFPLSLHREIGSNRMRLVVSRGPQARPFVRPDGGRGGVSSVIQDRLYRGVSAAGTPLDFFPLEVDRSRVRQLQSESFPTLETLAVIDGFTNPDNFPVSVLQYLPDLGRTALLVESEDGVGIEWTNVGSGGADSSRGVAEWVGPLLGPAEDARRFDAGAVRDARLVLQRRNESLVGWLLYRGFASIRSENDEIVYGQGLVGLARLEVTRRF